MYVYLKCVLTNDFIWSASPNPIHRQVGLGGVTSTPLLAKEIVKRIVDNNFRGFGFGPTQCSTSATSRATLTT